MVDRERKLCPNFPRNGGCICIFLHPLIRHRLCENEVPRFTRMEKSVCTTFTDGEKYLSTKEVRLLLMLCLVSVVVTSYSSSCSPINIIFLSIMHLTIIILMLRLLIIIVDLAGLAHLSYNPLSWVGAIVLGLTQMMG